MSRHRQPEPCHRGRGRGLASSAQALPCSRTWSRLRKSRYLHRRRKDRSVEVGCGLGAFTYPSRYSPRGNDMVMKGPGIEMQVAPPHVRRPRIFEGVPQRLVPSLALGREQIAPAIVAVGLRQGNGESAEPVGNDRCHLEPGRRAVNRDLPESAVDYLSFQRSGSGSRRREREDQDQDRYKSCRTTSQRPERALSRTTATGAGAPPTRLARPQEGADTGEIGSPRRLNLPGVLLPAIGRDSTRKEPSGS